MPSVLSAVTWDDSVLGYHSTCSSTAEGDLECLGLYGEVLHIFHSSIPAVVFLPSHPGAAAEMYVQAGKTSSLLASRETSAHPGHDAVPNPQFDVFRDGLLGRN